MWYGATVQNVAREDVRTALGVCTASTRSRLFALSQTSKNAIGKRRTVEQGCKALSPPPPPPPPGATRQGGCCASYLQVLSIILLLLLSCCTSSWHVLSVNVLLRRRLPPFPSNYSHGGRGCEALMGSFSVVAALSWYGRLQVPAHKVPILDAIHRLHMIGARDDGEPEARDDIEQSLKVFSLGVQLAHEPAYGYRKGAQFCFCNTFDVVAAVLGEKRQACSQVAGDAVFAHHCTRRKKT